LARVSQKQKSDPELFRILRRRGGTTEGPARNVQAHPAMLSPTDKKTFPARLETNTPPASGNGGLPVLTLSLSPTPPLSTVRVDRATGTRGRANKGKHVGSCDPSFGFPTRGDESLPTTVCQRFLNGGKGTRGRRHRRPRKARGPRSSAEVLFERHVKTGVSVVNRVRLSRTHDPQTGVANGCSCVLQFTRRRAVCSVLHRPTSRVIHRSGL
jgi:hypothetical protein